MIAKQIGFKAENIIVLLNVLYIWPALRICVNVIVIHFTYSRTKNKNERILYAYYLKINILMFLLLNWVSVLNSISVIFNQSL